MSNDNRIIIFDTTLRDGEQSPGASMNIEEKLRIAHQLERLNVDVMEAGFPIASEGDFEAVKKVAQAIKTTQVAGLARANNMDIDRAWEALQYAGERGRIHTFIATSEIHLKYKLKMSEQQVFDAAVAAVQRAANYTPNVNFLPRMLRGPVCPSWPKWSGPPLRQVPRQSISRIRSVTRSLRNISISSATCGRMSTTSTRR